MKKIIVLLFACSTVQSYALEKDRGGGVVPYAEGSSSVTLSWKHTQSIVKIYGNAAKLLFDSLNAEVLENTDPFAKRGENFLKEKDNVKCVSGSADPKTFVCVIKIDN